MRLPEWLIRRLRRWTAETMVNRLPDIVIGGDEDPYLPRWYQIPRNAVANCYLHKILRSDDDRALHDHPWWNVSIILEGRYVEHRIDAGGIERRFLRSAGDVIFRPARMAHRLEVLPGEHAVTLFLTGPRLRQWGFHCPKAGWVHWEDFTEGERGERVGRGCGEMGQ